MADRDKFTVEETRDRTGVRHLVNRLTDVTKTMLFVTRW